MKNGSFPNGSRVLRAKIDMTAPNINLRDPVMYRIMHTTHHRTGDAWCIYPLYDWAHGQSDSIEGVTHSLCSDEFINNRPLYDWFIQQLGIFPSRQIEFARGNITYTVLSKRYIRPLIEQQLVSGWDDPRLYTLRGLRRLGCPRPKPSAASGPQRASLAAATTSTSPSSNTASATSSTRPRPGAWPCSTRSRSSLKTIRRVKARC